MRFLQSKVRTRQTTRIWLTQFDFHSRCDSVKLTKIASLLLFSPKKRHQSHKLVNVDVDVDVDVVVDNKNIES